MMTPWLSPQSNCTMWLLTKLKPLLFFLATVAIISVVLHETRNNYNIQHIVGRKTEVTGEYFMENVPRELDAQNTVKRHAPISSISNQHNNYYNDGDKSYLVHTPGCKIPDIDQMDSSIVKYIKPLPPLVCNYTHPITYTDGLNLRINHTALELYYSTKFSYCEYQEIFRPIGENSDNLFKYKKPGVEFTEDVKVRCEFLRLACYDVIGDMMYSNFHAFIQPLNILNRTKVEQPFKSRLTSRANFPSILMVGIDSVSRLNFMRQMKDTRSFLLDKMHAIELKGYNKIADNTLVNLSPMLTGQYLHNLPWDEFQNESSPFDEYNLIWKQYHRHGYTTLFAEDAPELAIFNYMKEGFYEQPADYYLRPYSLALEKHSHLWNNNHDCFRDKPETEIVLDWSKDFLKKFRNDPYFAFLFLTRLTHEDVNKAGSADSLYKKYLESIYTSGLLNNTIVLFFSDHGMRFGSVRQTHIGKLEERLPFFFITFPTKYKELLSKVQLGNLNKNQNALTTPFDIHKTLLDILYSGGTTGDRSLLHHKDDPVKAKLGTSLFSVISENRNCDSAGIESHWCACHQRREINKLDPVIVKGSLYVVEDINTKLEPVSEYCEFVYLDSIEDALFKWTANNSNSNNTEKSSHNVTQEYLITFVVSPGKAVFEVTLKYDAEKQEKYEILGGPSRINRYGDSGKCVRQHSLQKYCYCREN